MLGLRWWEKTVGEAGESASMAGGAIGVDFYE